MLGTHTHTHFIQKKYINILHIHKQRAAVRSLVHIEEYTFILNLSCQQQLLLYTKQIFLFFFFLVCFIFTMRSIDLNSPVLKICLTFIKDIKINVFHFSTETASLMAKDLFIN